MTNLPLVFFLPIININSILKSLQRNNIDSQKSIHINNNPKIDSQYPEIDSQYPKIEIKFDSQYPKIRNKFDSQYPKIKIKIDSQYPKIDSQIKIRKSKSKSIHKSKSKSIQKSKSIHNFRNRFRERAGVTT